MAVTVLARSSVIVVLAGSLITLLLPLRLVAQSAGPRFEVVSVRPCDPNGPPPVALAASRAAVLAQASPVRFRLSCRTLTNLIPLAYVTFADGRRASRGAAPTFEITKTLPDWSRSETFTIEAITDAATPMPVMYGPMLQAVLEDRFKLKLHREAREVPVFDLVVAAGGAKVTPFKPGTCVPLDYSANVYPSLEPGQHGCDRGEVGHPDTDGRVFFNPEATTLDDFFNSSSIREGNPHYRFGAPVKNKTGITGLQTFRYVSPESGEDRAAEIRRQLGLELRRARGLHDFLIIDHVERPTPN